MFGSLLGFAPRVLDAAAVLVVRDARLPALDDELVVVLRRLGGSLLLLELLQLPLLPPKLQPQQSMLDPEMKSLRWIA